MILSVLGGNAGRLNSRRNTELNSQYVQYKKPIYIQPIHSVTSATSLTSLTSCCPVIKWSAQHKGRPSMQGNMPRSSAIHCRVCGLLWRPTSAGVVKQSSTTIRTPFQVIFLTLWPAESNCDIYLSIALLVLAVIAKRFTNSRPTFSSINKHHQPTISVAIEGVYGPFWYV